MTPQNDFEQQLDLYLSGKMNEAEMQAFEKDALQNPEFQAEVDFQKELVEGIRSFRKAELKAMLNNVPVGTGTGSFISFNLAATGIISALIIVTGLFVYNNSTSENEEFAYQLDLATAELIENKPIPALPSPLDIVEEENISQNSQSKRESASTTSSIIEKGDKKKKEENLVKVVLPEMDEQMVELADVFDTDIEESLGLGAVMNAAGNKTEIVTKESATLNFHYQYYNNKLYLYGDFSSSPYELLEIEIDGSRKLFFYFEGKYHRIINDTKEATQLRPLRNEKTIQELETLREKNK